MTDYQNAVQKMFIEVIEFCEDNIELVNANPILKKHYNAFLELYADLVKNKKIQETDFEGITKDKKRMKFDLAKEIFKLTGGVRSYATDNKNKELFDKFNSSTSDIRYGKDVDVTSYSQTVSDSLTQLKDVLEPYGVTEADTQTLIDNTTAFETQLALPAKMRKEVKVASDEIKEIITKMLLLLSDSINNDMLQYSKSQPKLYKKYIAMREIDDSQTNHLSAYGIMLYADTKQPILEGAVTVIRMVDGKEVILLIVETGPKGHYRCPDIDPPGMVIMRFESPDCYPQDKNVRIYKSKGVRVNVELTRNENYVPPKEDKEIE